MRTRRSRSASLPEASRWPVLLVAVTDMNANPLERAKTPVTLIGLFYGNLLELVCGVHYL